MAQQVRELTASRRSMWCPARCPVLTSAVLPIRGSGAFLWPLKAPSHTDVHALMQTHVCALNK